ncbi:MAG: DegQ family serine endoprotease [Verrucomicrobiota bacterium]
MKTTFLPCRAARRAGLLLGVGLACLAAPAGNAKETPKLSVSDRDVDRAARGASYANIIKRVTPSVVTIEASRTVQMRQFHHPFMDDPAFRRFFGQDDAPENSPRKMRQASLGSGIIVTEDGYLLTNNHVIDGADDDGVKIVMPDGKTRYAAKVVGRDPRTDIAVLKIESPKKLPAVTLADSDKLEVGDVVLAVGNPFGIGQSVSSGIISALGRGSGILGREGYEDFIQTDASINQGNSGGALVDAEGRLIGINQSIASPSGANAGVGFAVPINLARTVLEQLITDGKITRGYLGVKLQTITPELAEAFNLQEATGALVGEVQSGTPAAKAGLQDGDVIIGFNGKDVNDSAHLRIMVAQTPPKTAVSFKVLRNGQPKNFAVTLAELPDNLVAGRNDEASGNSSDAGNSNLKGVETTNLDRETRRQFDLPNRVRGVVVTKVDEDSAAGEAGLRPGDVIIEANRQPVRNEQELDELLGEAKGKRVLLRVFNQAGGQSGTRYLSVDLGKK